MNQKDIMRIAMQQSAIDSNCSVDDLKACENVLVISKKNAGARRYLDLPFLCDFTSYGNNIVASVCVEFEQIAKEYMQRYRLEHCFETPNMHWLTDKLEKHHANVCFMAEYFLPDLEKMPKLTCKYETKLLNETDFENLYTSEWSNALCKDRRHLDKLGVGAYDGGTLIGLAACSADCDCMWQIGVDVLPQYHSQGVGSSITNLLVHEILNRDIVPFYCCAWSNLKSVKNALKSGFVPAWVQMTVKSQDFINQMI